MKNHVILTIVAIAIVAVFLIGCGDRPFTNIRNNNISSVEVQYGTVTVRGSTRSTMIQVYGYSYRIENFEMYITVYLARTPRTPEERRITRRTPSVEFVSALPNHVERIFIEDNRHAILIWERSQGYGEFDIEEHWREKISKL